MPHTYNYKINLQKDWADQLKKSLSDHGYDVISNDSQDICIDYLNLVKRLVPPVKRKVLVSKEFKCPARYKSALEIIKNKIKNGESITPHLSKTILKLDYHDALLNDWDIHHLHLGDKNDVKNPKFINRTGPLIFIRFTNDAAYFINIYSHGSWSKQEMIKIIHRNWPKSIEPFRLKEVISLEHKINDKDYGLLRKNNISTLVEVDEGVVYFSPGMGYMSSGHSTEVIRSTVNYFNILRRCEKWVKVNISNIVKSYSHLGLNEYNHMYFYPIIKNNQLFVCELYSSIQIYMCDFN